MPGTGSAYDFADLVASGAASVAFSPDESRIYVAKYDGTIEVFDVASRTKLTTWDVGTSLGGLSLSEDGSFLLVVESFSPPFSAGGGGPPPPTPPQTSTFYRVDTGTGAVTTFTRAGAAYQDVEIVDGNVAILSGGQQQLTRFDLSTNSYSTLEGGIFIGSRSVLVEDERYTLIAQGGVSDGPLALYDDRAGAIVAWGNNYQTIGQSSGSTGFNFGHQAVSEAAGLVAQFIYSATINLYDLDLKFIRGFTLPGFSPVDGLAFDPSGRYLLVRQDQQLNKIEVSTGIVVDSFIVGTAQWHNDLGSGDQIVLSEDGKVILVKNNSTGQLQLIDLRLRDEHFEGSAGVDAFAGGKGDDTYVINNAADTISELLYDGDDLAIASVDYTLQPHVETLRLAGAATRGTGNATDNRIDGTDSSNLLQGLGGADVLVGRGGNDVMEGGSGNDILNGGPGDDLMDGGAGDDVYYVDSQLDRVIEHTGAGRDTVYTSISYRLDQTSQIEVLATSSETAIGAITLIGSDSANLLIGNAGANRLNGGAGNDSLFGLAGNDELIGGAGNDAMDGGAGNDVYYVDSLYDRVTDRAGQGRDVVYASTSYRLDATAEVEVLATASETATDTIDLVANGLANLVIGNAGANRLNGGAGGDSVFGLAGNDELIGGSGIDAMDGGTGNDSYYVDDLYDRVTERAGQGRDVIYASTSYRLDERAEVEVLATVSETATGTIDLIGNGLANLLIGNAGANRLNGGAGEDSLVGLAGNDELIGGDGIDAMDGGIGNDSYYVDNLYDRVTERVGQGRDVVYASASYILAEDAHIEALATISEAGTAAIDLFGNGFVNLIIGNAGVNRLHGGGGDDILFGLDGDDEMVGGAGADIMDGGLGNDTYYVDNASDRIVEQAGQGRDIVYVSTDYRLSEGAEVDVLATLSEAATDSVNLAGNAFVNLVFGNAGANVLDGDLGADTLIGLGGADSFAFSSALGGGNIDTIADFQSGTDKILLDDAIFSGLQAGALLAGAFRVGGSASEADDRILYDPITSTLYYDSDGSGATAAIEFATISGAPALAASDIFII